MTIARFEQLPPHLYADCVDKRSCLRCGRPVATHAPGTVAAAAPAPSLASPSTLHVHGGPSGALVDVDRRKGDAPRLRLDPAEALYTALRLWADIPPLPEDGARWREAFAMLQGALLDGSAAALDDAVASEGVGAATIFRLKTDIQDQATQAMIANALRRAYDAGMAILQILRIQTRADWRRNADPLRFFIRADVELPVDIFLAESIMRKTMRYTPGSVLPVADEQLTEPFHPLWWGVRLMTFQLDGFRERVERLFVHVVRRWRDANPKAWATSLEIKSKRSAPREIILLRATDAKPATKQPFGAADAKPKPTFAKPTAPAETASAGGRGGRGGRAGGRGRGRGAANTATPTTTPDPPIV